MRPGQIAVFKFSPKFTILLGSDHTTVSEVIVNARYICPDIQASAASEKRKVLCFKCCRGPDRFVTQGELADLLCVEVLRSSRL